MWILSINMGNLLPFDSHLKPSSLTNLLCLLVLYCAVVTGASNGTHCSNDPSPETYIFTFPEVFGVYVAGDHFAQQLALATPLSCDVTINVTTFRNAAVKDRFGPYTINCDSDSVIVPVWSGKRTDIKSTLLTVQILSSDRVNVYAFSFFKKNVDGILARPMDQVGQDYNVLSMPALAQLARAFFVVTAWRDNTSINISKTGMDVDLDLSTLTTAAPVQLSDTGEVLTLELDSYQTVSSISTGDLAGLRVRSDKPVSLSSGVNRDKVNNSCCYDHMWVQLPGVHVWGREYITFPTSILPNNTTDIYFLAAAEDNTTVHLDDLTTFTFAEAMVWQQTELDVRNFHVFYSDSPFIVVKTVKGARDVLDPCMVTLTDTLRWSTTLSFPKPNTTHWEKMTYKYLLTIITESSQSGNIRVNGKVPQITWKQVPTSNNFSSLPLMGGDLSHAELLRLGRDKYLLTSVNGAALMTAYITGFADFRGFCYPLGGDLVEIDERISTHPTETTTPFTTAAATALSETTTVTETTDSAVVSSTLELLATDTTGLTTDNAVLTTNTTELTTDTTELTTDTMVLTTDTTELTTDTTKLTTDTTELTTDTMVLTTDTTELTTDTTKLTTDTTVLATDTTGLTTDATGLTTDATELTTDATVLTTDTTGLTTDTTELTTDTTVLTTDAKELTTDATELTTDTTVLTTDATELTTDTKVLTTDTTVQSTLTESITTQTTTADLISTPPDQPKTIIPAQKIQPCYCVKNSPRASTISPAQKEAEKAAREKIVQELTLPSGNLSSTVRKVTSAPDSRQSSAAMGAVAVTFIALILGIIVFFDVLRLFLWLRSQRSKDRVVSVDSAQDEE